MRIACLQFAPQVGDVNNNLNRADAVLSKANPEDLDLLVLPELAFSGYNFRSLHHISPYLEPTAAGITSLWARTTALKYNCVVAAGYPEKVDLSAKWPANPEYYNSVITVNADGETITNYRKSFLYYTDETWALEGKGFYAGKIEGLGNVAMGICMDLNPYKFEAPWYAWEFAHHILHVDANLVIMSMAWLTREDPRAYSRVPREPDMETLSYWLARLEPVIRAEAAGEIIVVFANRCGAEDEAVYAGTSTVLGINAGEVKVYGILGRGERELLVVDTSRPPQAKLVSEPHSSAVVAPELSPLPDITTTAVSTSPAYDGSDSSPEDDDGYYEFSPVSPSDSRFPQAFFGPKTPVTSENPRDSLRSSIGRTEFGTPSPGSPTLYRPSSPKSRNASRNRQREEPFTGPTLLEHEFMARFPIGQSEETAAEPALLEHNLLTKSPVIQSRETTSQPTLSKYDFETRSPTGPGEQTVSEPALFEHDLKVKSPIGEGEPNSASSVPDNYQSTFSPSSLGPRGGHVSPRPNSTLW